MAIKISIALQKGGTGKTTTATTISGVLGAKGYKVLLIDMDSQCNASFISGDTPDHTIIDVLTGDCSIMDAIASSSQYDYVAADEYLANIERIEDLESTLLKNVIGAADEIYDFIIIDTPPALGNSLKNCLVASDYVLIPTEARPFAIQGLSALEDTIQAVQDAFKQLKVLGIVLVKYSTRTVLNRQMKDLLEKQVANLNTTLFNTTIREGIAVGESQALQLTLIDYAPKSKPCIDYISLTDEILERIEV